MFNSERNLTAERYSGMKKHNVINPKCFGIKTVLQSYLAGKITKDWLLPEGKGR